MNTFIAVTRRGIMRAEKSAADWKVEHLLQEHIMACLAADPHNPNVIYAGSHDAGVLRSEDHGRTWQASGMSGQIVKSLAVSPHDPNVIFAGSKSATLFRSDDGGRTWAELAGFRRIPNRWWWFSPAEPPDRRPYVIAIAPSPTAPDVLLSGVELGGVMRSVMTAANPGRVTCVVRCATAIRSSFTLRTATGYTRPAARVAAHRLAATAGALGARPARA